MTQEPDPVTTPSPGYEVCYECRGERVCLVCRGAKTLAGKRCANCSGQGVCIVCEGEGQIRKR